MLINYILSIKILEFQIFPSQYYIKKENKNISIKKLQITLEACEGKDSNF